MTAPYDARRYATRPELVAVFLPPPEPEQGGDDACPPQADPDT